MDAPTVRAIAEREVLVPEPTLREAFVRVVLTRPAKRIACVVVILFLLVDVFPPLIAPYDPLRQSMLQIHQTPSAAHLLGTDTAELTPGMVADSLADFHETEPVFADHGLVHSGCLVRATTDTGAEGWGQVPACNADIACNLLHRKVAPHALGADALDFADLIDLIGERACKFPGACLRRATLGLDTALWDLRGKVEGKPVTALIGDTTGRLRIYGLSMRRDIDQRPGRSVAIVPHVARALGERTDKPVDGNSGFTPARAIGLGRILSDNGISHFEEPCPGWEFDWTRQVRDALPADITGGEQDCEISAWNSMISMHVVDVVQPDIPCLGGLCRTVRVARMAAAAGRPCTPHAANHGLVTAASMHLLWVIPNAGKYREYSIEGPYSQQWADGLFLERPFVVTDGQVEVTDAPGWGVTVNPAFLDKSRHAVSEIAGRRP